MERKAILVEPARIPKRVVYQIETQPTTMAICPVCQTPFKKDDLTVWVDLVRRFRITIGSKDSDGEALRVSICTTCAKPVILQQQKAMDEIINLLAGMIVNNMIRKGDAQVVNGSAADEKLESNNSKSRHTRPRSRTRRSKS